MNVDARQGEPEMARDVETSDDCTNMDQLLSMAMIGNGSNIGTQLAKL